MATDAIGLYLHIPFCVRKCNYCDFCSFDLSTVDWKEEYINRLCEEIVSYKDREIKVDTIFFGGGTPSLLTPLEFERICSAIKDSFCVLSECEFTIEANPKTLDREKLASFVKCGVNRLSIGLQSIYENEMKILGRIHSYDDFAQIYHLARECGIDNINVDLMYGIPEQTMDSFGQTVDAVLRLKPEHISLYGLILEEGTPFFERRDSLPLPSEDHECDMYYLAADKLRSAGYTHYEISNYALDGRQCQHNLNYWRCEEYIGLGLAAYSYFEGRRFGNSDDPAVYISNNCVDYEVDEDATDAAFEYVMLRLRLAEGFSLSDYKEHFGVDFLSSRRELIDSYLKAGYISISDDRIALTERGFYVSNSILTELL